MQDWHAIHRDASPCGKLAGVQAVVVRDAARGAASSASLEHKGAVTSDARKKAATGDLDGACRSS